MKKTCTYCGETFDDKAAKCPKCGRAVKPAPVKAAEPPKKQHHGLLIFLIVFIFIVAVVTAAVIVDLNYMKIPFVDDILTSIGIIDKDNEKEKDDHEEDDTDTTSDEEQDEDDTDTHIGTEPETLEPFSIEYEDPDTLYKNVKKKVEADSSPDLRSESEAIRDFGKLGFNQNPVTYSYDKNGEFSFDASEASSSSQEQHPVYETYYVTERGDIWTVSQINGSITAFPVSYNMEEDEDVDVIVAEDYTVTSYASVNNTFYVITPDKTELRIVKVPQINAKTLEELSYDDLREHEVEQEEEE